MEQDRLAGIEEGLRDVNKAVGEVNKTVAGIKATVDLLVQGKIKQNGNGSANESSAVWSKVTMTAMEVARLAVAAMAGFFAGKGN